MKSAKRDTSVKAVQRQIKSRRGKDEKGQSFKMSKRIDAGASNDQRHWF